MKKLNSLALSLRLFVAGCLIFSASGCVWLGEVSEFQLYSGNETLPPQYQKVLIIYGWIKPDKIIVSYRYRSGTEKFPPSVSLELIGEDREKCLRLIENTSIWRKLSFTTGGGAFDVTLKDADGKSKMGKPSNPEEWRQFAEEITEKAKASEARQ